MPRKRNGSDPIPEPSAEDLSWSLHQLLVTAAALDVTLARRFNLGQSEYQAMKHLMTAERPLGPVELGALVGLTSGSATTLVDRLERAGHVARHPDPRDRRRITLTATSRAMSDARKEMRPLEESLNTVLESYSPDDRRVAARFLRDAIAMCQDFRAGMAGGAQAPAD